jgi:hypothetical protein
VPAGTGSAPPFQQANVGLGEGQKNEVKKSPVNDRGEIAIFDRDFLIADVCRRSNTKRMAMSALSCRSKDAGILIGRPEDHLITATVNDFSRMSGLGVSTVWKLIAEQELETISVGKRRLVVIASYRRLVERKLAEGPQDARRNNRVPAAGSKARGTVST